MRNKLVVGLFTATILLFASPGAAEEQTSYSRFSFSEKAEDIRKMVQRSQERQGIVLSTTDEKPTRILDKVSANTPAPATTPDPVTKSAHDKTTSTSGIRVESIKVHSHTKVNTPTPSRTLNLVRPATTSASTNSPSSHPNTVTFAEPHPQNIHQPKVVPQLSQQVSVRHASMHRNQRESADPEPSRQEQISNKSFMLFVADLAWERVDNKSDYGLGARLERGTITPLAALRVYAPNRISEALAILAGEKEYT
jgi:hypothetical protein